MKFDGTLYIGYPVLVSADETVTVDALLVCREHGLVVFSFEDNPPRAEDTVTWSLLQDRQDQLYFVLETHLSRHRGLRAGRQLGVRVEPVTVFPTQPEVSNDIEGTYVGISELPSVLTLLPEINNGFSAHYRPRYSGLPLSNQPRNVQV
jgi:hypothetical protein